MLLALSQLPPTRKLLLKLKDPGEGPSAEQREKGWFRVRFHGEGGGQRVVTEVSGGDPGYGETAKMLAESALCLAHDELPDERRPGHAGGGDGRRADPAPAARGDRVRSHGGVGSVRVAIAGGHGQMALALTPPAGRPRRRGASR